MSSPSALEERRLDSLRRYNVLDTVPEEGFDRIVGLSAHLFDVPIALISFMDRDRQWFKARVGWDGTETPRAVSFCKTVLEADQLCVVDDASTDPRFATNPLVTGAPGVRFYAGAPIRTGDGHMIGTLCILDTKPHPGLTDAQRAVLANLASIVMTQLELRRELEANETSMRRSALREELLGAVADAPTFRSAIDIVTRAICDATQAVHCLFFLLAPDGIRLRLLGAHSADPADTYVAELGRLPLLVDNTLIGVVIAAGGRDHVHRFGEATGEAFDATVLARRHGLRTALLTSIELGTSRYGVALLFGEAHRDLNGASMLLQGITGSLRPLLRRLRDHEDVEMFRRAVAACNDAVLITEADTLDEPGPRIVYVNDVFVAQTGYRPEEVLGWTPRMLQGPGTSPDSRAAIRAALEGGRSINQRILNYRRDGSPMWVDLKIAPVVSETGWVTHFVSIQTDVTDQQTRIETIERSEAAFRTLFVEHPVPMWLYDTDTLAFLEVNQAAVIAYGWSREAFLRKSLLDIRLPEDHARTWVAVRDGQYLDQEGGVWRHRTASGEIRTVQAKSRTTIFNRRPARLSTMWDITDRLRAESEAQDAMNRLQATFESISDGLATLDRGGRFTYVNANAGQMLECESASLIGRPIWWTFKEHATRAVIVAACRRAAAADGATTLEVRHDPLGKTFDVTIYPFNNGYTVYFRDITERQRHAALVAWQAAMLAEAQDAIVIRSLDHRVLFWNRTAEQLYGYAADEVLGRVIDDRLFENQSELADAVAEVTRSQRWSGRIRQRRKTGEMLTVAGHWSLIGGSQFHDASILTISSDLTAVLALEQQQAQAARLAATGRMTSGIAHDFNNLLTVVLGNSELMLELAPDDKILTELASLSRTAALRGAELTNRLLAFAQQQPLDLKPVDIGALLGGMEPLISRTLGAGIAIEHRRRPALWTVRADAVQVESAILNLCINARDAIRPGHGTVTIGVENVAVREPHSTGAGELHPGDYVVVAVTDTGAGMATDVSAKAFDPFFTTKGVGKGSGLGLSMVYGYLKQSGGHVTIDSSPGQGTSVRVYLPRSVEAVAPSRGERSTVRLRGMETILVVEDDVLVGGQARMQLTTLGYTVRMAQTGRQALAMLEEDGSPDLLLTDIMLAGDMNGWQLAAAAVRLRPGLRVIYTTGFADHEIPPEQGLEPRLEPRLAPRLEPWGLMLSKPYSRDDLASTLRQAFGGQPPA